MTAALLLLAASLASYSGFACFALAMPRHWAAASGRSLAAVPHRRALRLGGFALLAGTYGLCVYRDGPSFGSVLWVVLIPMAAIAVALTLAWRPQWLLPAVWPAVRGDFLDN